MEPELPELRIRWRNERELNNLVMKVLNIVDPTQNIKMHTVRIKNSWMIL